LTVSGQLLIIYISRMKNNLGLFIQKENRKMTFAFLLFLLFFVFSVVSLCRGIEGRETWRILTASAGALACITLCSVTVFAIIKPSKKAVTPAKAVKR
jgi:O-antigen ligase